MGLEYEVATAEAQGFPHLQGRSIVQEEVYLDTLWPLSAGEAELHLLQKTSYYYIHGVEAVTIRWE